MDVGHYKGFKILLVTPEVTFLPRTEDKSLQVTGARAGGLADISACLVHSLNDLQMDVHVAVPYYRNAFQKNTISSGSVEGHRRYERLPTSSVHLARDRSFFYQPKLSGLPIWENVKISLAFQREVINRIIPEVQPDLIHCFDWMTGLIPAMTRQFEIPCLFTLYNMASTKVTLAAVEEQGIDAASFWQNCYFTQMPGSYEETRESNPVDFLMSAIFAAHFVNTVSTTFCQRLLKEDLPGIEPALRRELWHKAESGCLSAIDHGPDPSYNPANDRFLFRRYTPKDQHAGKTFNKLHLQERLSLPLDSRAPLFFWPTRLDKIRAGCRLIVETLPTLLERFATFNPQIVFIADGDFQQGLRDLVNAMHAGDHVAVTDFDARLRRLAYAAADFVLLPVANDPCGLPCKIGQRYGALPVVYHTTAIQSTISHMDCSQNQGNGFVFNNLDAGGILWVLEQCMAFHRKPMDLKALQLERIMTESVDRYNYSETIAQYIALYESMLQRKFRHDGSQGMASKRDDMAQRAA